MLKKMTIQPCKVSSGKVSTSGTKFEVLLNPASYNHEHSIKYNYPESNMGDRQSGNGAIGRLAPEPKFQEYGAEKISFELVFDGTGVVEANGSTTSTSLKDQLKNIAGLTTRKVPKVETLITQLKDTVYNYDGTIHEPRVVQLKWGNFTFNGRLESLSLDYTLFDPSGVPLRAKAKVSFVRYVTEQESTLLAKQSSPDLTHDVVTKAGDTLPKLCYEIYSDASYYPEVAQINNLRTFRDLKPGTALRFPPLD